MKSVLLMLSQPIINLLHSQKVQTHDFSQSWAESCIHCTKLMLSLFQNTKLCCFVALLTLSLSEDKSKYETLPAWLVGKPKRFFKIVTYKFNVNIYVLLKSFTFSFPLYISKFTFNKNIREEVWILFFSHHYIIVFTLITNDSFIISIMTKISVQLKPFLTFSAQISLEFTRWTPALKTSLVTM